MKCEILFSEKKKNEKNISICHLLKILPRVLNVNTFIGSSGTDMPEQVVQTKIRYRRMQHSIRD